MGEASLFDLIRSEIALKQYWFHEIEAGKGDNR